MRICDVDGCERKHWARGYCGLHYDRWKRLGVPDITPLIEKCILDYCNEKHLAKGYCCKHYHRFKRHGDPGIRNKQKMTTLERFHSSYMKNENNCFEWIKMKNTYGYGIFNFDKQRVRAHRFAFENFVGELKPSYFVCHKCDNPGCVNPDHLFLGTPADNAQDMRDKKRHVIPIGEHNGKSKLKSNNVRTIKRFLSVNVSSVKLARMFNVSKDAIMDIKNNKTWRHININQIEEQE